MLRLKFRNYVGINEAHDHPTHRTTPLQGSKAVKDEIINYDAHKITPEMRARVSKLMDSKGNSFEQAVGVGGKCVGSGFAGGKVMRVAMSGVLCPLLYLKVTSAIL